MSAEDRKNPDYSPTYLQVLRPEKVINEIDSAEEIRALGQLMHDKTDDLKVENQTLRTELKQENAELRKMMEIQMQNTSELRDMLMKMLADQHKSCKT